MDASVEGEEAAVGTENATEGGDDEGCCLKGRVSLPSSPVNLVPKETIPKLRPVLTKEEEEQEEEEEEGESAPPAASSGAITPPNSWTGLCGAPYFFPTFQFPFLYPLAEPSTIFTSPLDPSKPLASGGSPTPPQVESKPKERNAARYEDQSFRGPRNGEPSLTHQYQVKWSNHASRLSSFVSSLEGDVATSDTIVSAKDGTTFYAHRLVLASASPFFSRTLKFVPKEQQAVVVIPKASSRSIAAVLSFCYNGFLTLATEESKPVFELAEDLEITGLMQEREKQALAELRRSPSPSPVFTFTPPASYLPSSFYDKSSHSAMSLYRERLQSPGPLPGASWKREGDPLTCNTQPLKRIKSESDVQKYSAKRPMKMHPSDPLNKKAPSPLHSSLLPFSLYASPPSTPSGDEEPHSSGIFLPRQGGGTGSRVLLWRFLLQLLHDSRYSPYYIKWIDRRQGTFRIMESDKVAQLWGLARKNKNMTYEKMSRGMRTYYKRSILYHLDGTKLIYRFNTQEPEIQHQLRYYDLMQAKVKDESTSPSTGNVTQDRSEEGRSRIEGQPYEASLSPADSKSTTPLTPHLVQDVPHTMCGYNSTFPPQADQ